MRYALSEEQRALQEALDGWLKDAAPSEKLRDWILEAPDHAPFEQMLAETGWSGLGIPDEAGGQGGELVELALAAERFGGAAAPTSAWTATAIAMPLVLCDPHLTEAVIAGRSSCLVVSSGEPPASGSLTVDEDGRLRGSVALVLAGDRAHHLLVPVERDGSTAVAVVAPGTDGVTVTPRPLLDGSRTAADVTFDGVEARWLEGATAEHVGRCGDRAAVLVAADAVGIADRARELAVEYSQQREQFGVPIGSFQAVKHACAQMLVATEPVRSVVYFAAYAVQHELPGAARYAAVAKAQSATMVVDVVEASLTVHGAIGFTWEHDLQLFYKRAKLDHVLFGAPGVWNDRVARSLAADAQGDLVLGGQRA